MRLISVYDLNTGTGEIVRTLQDATTICRISERNLSRYLTNNKQFNNGKFIIFRADIDKKNENKVRLGRKYGSKNLQNRNNNEI